MSPDFTTFGKIQRLNFVLLFLSEAGIILASLARFRSNLWACLKKNNNTSWTHLGMKQTSCAIYTFEFVAIDQPSQIRARVKSEPESNPSPSQIRARVKSEPESNPSPSQMSETTFQVRAIWSSPRRSRRLDQNASPWNLVQSELEDLKWHLIRINHYLKSEVNSFWSSPRTDHELILI